MISLGRSQEEAKVKDNETTDKEGFITPRNRQPQLQLSIDQAQEQQ